MLEELKEKVLEANLLLPKHGLVVFTWGNVSGIDRERELIVIKPSGVSYDEMKTSDMVVVDFAGNVVEGTLRPSSDTPTHIELYRSFQRIGGVCHTHSRWATSFAQAGKGLIPLGTTHADYFCGEIPCTRSLSDMEIADDYEKETGAVIIETINERSAAIPGVLVKNHGPFSWGDSPYDAVHNAVVMEEIAFMNYHTMMVNPGAELVSQALLDKHYFRKHGAHAYYGQGKS